MLMPPSQRDRLNGFGDVWSDIAQTISNVAQSGAQAFTAITNQNTVAKAAAAGISPLGYNNGVPVYASTPSGVTPASPYYMPSGLNLPAGVTPSPVNNPAYYPPASFLSNPQTMYILLGGGALILALAILRR